MKLTAKARKAIPKSKFAGPGRSFPIEDAEHAKKAIQLAPRSLHAGNISKSTEEHIISKAHAKLGKQHEKPMNEHGHRHGGPHEHLSPTATHFHKL